MVVLVPPWSHFAPRLHPSLGQQGCFRAPLTPRAGGTADSRPRAPGAEVASKSPGRLGNGGRGRESRGRDLPIVDPDLGLAGQLTLEKAQAGVALLHASKKPDLGRGDDETDLFLQFPRGSQDRRFVAPDVAPR